MNTTKCCMWKTLVKGLNKECGWICARWQKGPVHKCGERKKDLLMCPHNVPWLTMEDFHLWYLIVDPYMTSDVMMKPYQALWNEKAPTPKETETTQKKRKEQGEERTNIQARDNGQRDNTQNYKCKNRGHKREREMKWNELLRRFFIHSFLSFLV